MGSSTKSRRLHSKSRKGCVECKRRHIKCDEQRPACVNCTVSQRSCSYIQMTAQVPKQSPAVSNSSDGPFFVSQRLDQASDRYFTIHHFTLFNHVTMHIDDWLAVSESMRPFSQLYMRIALKSPSVMHQLLAIAALHLGHQDCNLSSSYRQMAAELQNDGLSLFTSTSASVGEQDTLVRFVFSSLVSMQILAEELSFHRGKDLGAFIDSFTNHINIYQGARIVGQGSWSDIHDSELNSWFLQLQKDQAIDKLYLSRSQESVTAMLQSSQLEETAIEACVTASQTLDFVRRRLHSTKSWGPHAPMAWVNLVSKEFVQLLKNRTPEALVLLAHFAELLHYCREFWIFGDAGAHLIRAIATDLGTSWTPWLEGPLEAIGLKNGYSLSTT